MFPSGPTAGSEGLVVESVSGSSPDIQVGLGEEKNGVCFSLNNC